MTIGSRIKKCREKLGLTQDELAKKIGYKSRSSINKIELDQYDLPQSKIKAFAEALETSPGYIMGWDDEPQNYFQADNILKIETKRIKLLGNVACGEPIFCDEEKELYVAVGSNVKADFALRAKGDSMIGARIYDGDIVFCREQPMVENGEIAAVIIGDEATLKRVNYDRENNLLLLYPENPQYKTLRYSGEELNDIRILGKAVAFQSDIR